MKNEHKMLYILEVVWLAIGIIGIISFIYSMIKGDHDQSVYFIIFTIVSGVMYAVRRRQRKRVQSNNQENKK
ncbi:MAG: hypothetical protein IT235_00830 [Bacteroidia bacterium]|nr:hypothetical protein [Bacteroidia bacterium]